jgi:putative membrane protein
MTADSTKFGDGVIKYVYYFILVTHIVLSIIIIPFADYLCARLGASL